MNKKKLLIALGFSLIMIMSAFAIIDNGQAGQAAASSGSSNLSTQASNPQTSSATAWQMPTTTMQEPGYTNGTFKMGIDCNAGSLNYFTADTYCDVYITDEIYDTLYNDLPNGQSIPWLATNLSVQQVTTNNQTFDIMTNSTVNYSYVYTVNLRPYVQWTDWSAANASDTYVFSNHTVFYYNGNLTSHTYKSFKSTTMKTYYLQSADVVLSWRLQSGLGLWPNVVNVIPNGNLSVKIFVTAKTLLFEQDVLDNDILPYHIWVKHDFTSIPGLFNCTPGISSGNGYYDWDLGWNTATGSVPGLVGTGPFMVTNNYGLPQGQVTPSHQEIMYVNPHYFVQYANASSGLRQYTPKFYEIDMPFYSSESSLIAAYDKGEIETPGGVPANFKPQVESAPGSYLYLKPSSAYLYLRLNTAYAPLNVTAFRQALNYATPYSYIDTVVDEGYGYSSSSPINPDNILYYNTSSPNYNFNMQKAKELINSIPGMVNVSGVLTYYGTPVSFTLQTSAGAVNPAAIECEEAIVNEWNTLGIKTSLKEEAFTTQISNLDGTIDSYNYTTGTYSSNLCQIGELGLSTAFGNPALDCQELLTTTYGISTDEYVGPFTNLTYNGKDLTGVQVQDLFNNLTTKLVNTDNQSEAEKLSKEIQTLYVLEAPSVMTGYGTDIIPELDTFTNYSHTNTEASYAYWYWQFFSIYENPHVVKVQQQYHLTVKAVLNNATIENSGDYGSVTFTVYNGSKLVSGAAVAVGVSAPYGGIINVSSTQLKSNSHGQAIFEYKVFNPMSKLLVGCNPVTNQTYLIHNEEVNITGYATVSNQPQTGPGSGQATLWLISHSLDISWTPNHGTFTAGEHGTIQFYVSYNGTAYSDATIYISPVDLNNITYNSSELKLTTNSAGYASFKFTADTNITGTFDQSLVVNATPSSSSSIAPSPNVTLQFQLGQKVTSSTLTYVEIGGAVAAAVIIIGVATYVIRKPKVSDPKSGNSGSGTSGQ